jgi:small subunit ribosomal protein S9
MSQPAQYLGTGKRKTSVARVILRPGDGATWINGRTVEEYFPRTLHQNTVMAPFRVAGLEGRYDLRVRVHGGGPSGQAGAVRHGIARALVEADPELRVMLKREGPPALRRSTWPERPRVRGRVAFSGSVP